MSGEDLREEELTRKSIFEGKIIQVEQWDVRLPNGKIARRDIVKHPGAVAVLAELKNGNILLVQQYRTAPGEVMLEMPAGKLEAGEDPADCAKRELVEETGFVCGGIQKVYEFFTSPGFADEYIHLYYATELSEGVANPDEDEFVTIVQYSRTEIEELLATGAVRDAKTLIGLLWWLQGPHMSHER